MFAMRTDIGSKNFINIFQTVLEILYKPEVKNNSLQNSKETRVVSISKTIRYRSRLEVEQVGCVDRRLAITKIHTDQIGILPL